MARWDFALRVAGIAGVLVAYGLYVKAGANITVLFAVIGSILAVISPEAVNAAPIGPSK